jgi:hypothetical protein
MTRTRASCMAALCLASLIPATAGAGGQPAAPPTPPWPGDASLEARGARIGTITVRNLPIFDPTVKGERKALYRFADRAHIDTRAGVIEAHLLFRPGDLYSRRRLDETERYLRGLRFIREPQIRIVGYRDGLVDLEVVVHEVWTTNPGVSLGRSGGKNSTSFQLEELNLLGFGKQFAVDYSDNIDRTSYTFRWRDPAIWGSRWRNELIFRDSDDGTKESVIVDRPFFALDTRWSAGLESVDERSIERVYRAGDIIAGYEQDTELGEVRFGWSRGLRDGWSRRINIGLRHEQASFNFAPDETPPVALPRDRELDYPFLRFDGVQDDFDTTRNRDQIARTEDQHFGLRYALELGFAAPAFGSDRSAGLMRAEVSRGYRLADEQYLFAQSSLSGRFESDGFADGLLAAGLRYYRETGPKSRFFASLNADVGYELDPDHELVLGGDTGLRGYPLRFQTGSGRTLMTLEQRYYSNLSLWRLADIGGAVFFDMGRSWGDSAFGPTGSQELLKDIGVGLRLGASKTSLGNVLHIDLAFPLDGPRSIDDIQLLVETKASF